MENELNKIAHELREQRLAKNFSLEEISAQTKISISYLQKLEEGNFHFLPVVYVRAFLKTFAEQLGLNPDVMANRLNDALEKKAKERDEKNQQEQTLSEQKSNEFKFILWFFRPLIMVAILLLVMVVMLILKCPSDDQKNQTFPFESMEMHDNATRSVPDSAEKPVEKQQPDVELKGFQKQEHILRATAIETTWVRIVFQDSLADEAIFYPGDVKSWESHSPFYLKLGNGGGLRISLDDQNLGLPGQSGQVANVKVDRSGMTRISHNEFIQQNP
ncbi:DUF4115 domain-containing protein [candidate division KSB1 bacterium]|nr:DUF4115 domain-containing protein [candidate division KSB1 bacterium]